MAGLFLTPFLLSQALEERKEVHVWELVLLELLVVTSLTTSVPPLPRVKRRVLRELAHSRALLPSEGSDYYGITGKEGRFFF